MQKHPTPKMYCALSPSKSRGHDFNVSSEIVVSMVDQPNVFMLVILNSKAHLTFSIRSSDRINILLIPILEYAMEQYSCNPALATVSILIIGFVENLAEPAMYCCL